MVSARWVPLAFLLLLGTGACVARVPSEAELATVAGLREPPQVPAGPPLAVLVLGDHGTGGPGQRAVARAIARTHRASPPDLVLTVGDNFYPVGVYNRTDELWRTAFEDVYAGPFWDRLVFHPTLGNHDHLGYPRAQVGYSSASPRWHMPGMYYGFRRPIPGGGEVLFVALDTQGLRSGDEEAEAQEAWIESVLRDHGARWVVVYGHHPLARGAGPHPASSRVRRAVLPYLEGPTIFLGGHNHTLELTWLEPGLPQGLCGGGGGLDNPHGLGDTEAESVAFTGGGWCHLRIWPGTAALDLYDREGNLRHRALLPRASPARAGGGSGGP